MGALSERAVFILILILESLSGILGKAAVCAAELVKGIIVLSSELILAVVAGDWAAAI